MNGDRIAAVKTDQGEIEGDEFVLSGGAWSTDLAKPLGIRIPLQAGKGYSVTLQNPKQLPKLCSIFTEARVAVTPMGNSLRFGGTMEIAGLNSKISTRRVDGIIRSVPKYFRDSPNRTFSRSNLGTVCALLARWTPLSRPIPPMQESRRRNGSRHDGA